MEAKITSRVVTNQHTITKLPYFIVKYELPEAEPNSSLGIIGIPLVGSSSSRPSYTITPRDGMNGKSYAIELRSIRLVSKSPDWTISFLSSKNVSVLGDLEFIFYRKFNIPYFFSSDNLRIIVRNYDEPQENKIYASVVNHHTNINTGPISIELIYTSLQDQPFIQNMGEPIILHEEGDL